jgi:hypothetical protein
MHPGSTRSRDLLLRHPAQTAHPHDVDDLATLAERIEAFEQRYNAAATPFDWRFNTDDLNRLLHRLKP